MTTNPATAEARIPALTITTAIDRRLREFFTGKQRDAEHLGPPYVELWRSLAASTFGGKRVRPGLVLAVHQGLGGTADDEALDTAIAFELLHTAFLLHDDVIDGDTVRRGVPNLVGEFAADASWRGLPAERARQWGESAAILGGDLLIHFAQSLVARLDTPAAARSALLDLIDQGMFVTAAGELADVAFSVGMVPAALADVLAMTEQKTAMYSFAAPLVAGAILAGADDELCDALAEFGRLVGIAFQLRDDLLGVFGEETETGKSASNDLREGKETSLIAFARGTTAWAAIEPLFGLRGLSGRDADRIRRLLEACGARDFVEGLVGQYTTLGREVLERAGLPRALQLQLDTLAHDCERRAA